MIRQRVGSSPEMPYPGGAPPGLQMEPHFMTSDDDRLAAELAEQAGTLLLGLRAEGGDAGDLRKAGDRRSHEFLAAELAARRPGDAVLSEEGRDDRARLWWKPGWSHPGWMARPCNTTSQIRCCRKS